MFGGGIGGNLVAPADAEGVLGDVAEEGSSEGPPKRAKKWRD